MNGAEVQNLVERLRNEADVRKSIGAKPLAALLLDAADCIEGYMRALSAHHDIANLSDDVIRGYDYRECPVCRKVRPPEGGPCSS